MLRLPAMMLGSLGGLRLTIVAAIVSAPAALAAVVIATGFGYHDPRTSSSTSAGREKPPAPRTTTRSAPRSRSAGWCMAPQPQGPHRAAGDAPLGAACAEAAPRRAPTRRVSPRDRFEPSASTPRRRRRRGRGRRGRRGRRDRDRAAPRARKPARARSRRKSSGGYQLPELIAAGRAEVDRHVRAEPGIDPGRRAPSLESVLGDFGVRGEIINARPGPVVTLYELEPAPGIKSSRVIGLADDIARSMSALSARVAVVSGRNAIGIELPNDKREKVYFREMLASDEYTDTQAKLPLCLGKTIGGEPVIVDLARMPHLLIAGTTGSGKSVAINTMILSLLYRLTPDQCRLIMVDPKMLELSVYDGIPHLLTPVVTDPKKAVVALKWAVREMEERYKKMSKLGVRNIDGYNARLAEAKAKGETLSPHRAHRLRQGIRRGDLREGGARSRAAALHRRHRRRDGRPDDGRRQGHRRRGAAPRADGARRRHPRHPGDPASVGRRHHRHHQGELPDPHLLPGHLEDRQPHHPGRAGRRAAPRPGRHALHGGRRPHQPRPRPVLLGRRGREDRPAPQVAGPAAIPRSRHRGRGGESTTTAIRCSTPPAWARPATPPTSTSRRSRS